MKHRDDLANGSGPPDEGPDEDMERLLDEVAAVETREREEAERLKDAPGLPRVERVLEEVWASSERPVRRRWLGPILLATLAAAVLAFFYVRHRSATDTDGPPDQFLNTGDIVLRVPGHAVEAWPSLIEWSGPTGAPYTVVVLDPKDGATLLRSAPILGMKLDVAPEETLAWPSRIRIELRTLDEDGSPLFAGFDCVRAR